MDAIRALRGDMWTVRATEREQSAVDATRALRGVQQAIRGIKDSMGETIQMRGIFELNQISVFTYSAM